MPDPSTPSTFSEDVEYLRKRGGDSLAHVWVGLRSDGSEWRVSLKGVLDTLAQNERDLVRYQEREQKIVRALKVGDGGRYINDILEAIRQKDDCITSLCGAIEAARTANLDKTDIGAVGTVEQTLREALQRVPKGSQLKL